MTPTTAENWMAVANDRAMDAEAIEEKQPNSVGSVYMAGYAIECSLKALLQKRGIPTPTFGKDKFYDRELPQNMPLLLFWVHAYGTLKGDRAHFKLTAPNDRVMVDNEQVLDASNRSWMGYVGQRNTPSRPIIPGVWRGEYQLIRGSRLPIEIDRDLNVI